MSQRFFKIPKINDINEQMHHVCCCMGCAFAYQCGHGRMISAPTSCSCAQKALHYHLVKEDSSYNQSLLSLPHLQSFRSCVKFASNHIVLTLSACIALATALFVPPDKEYLTYFDFKTLACLFCILATVSALRNKGIIDKGAHAFITHCTTSRSIIGSLIALTLVLSMFITNDMALVILLPLAATTLMKVGWEKALPFTLIMQNLAANLGGMILPFGNPQNLYLYAWFDIPFLEFLSIMAPPFCTALLLIALCWLLFPQKELSCGTFAHDNTHTHLPSDSNQANLNPPAKKAVFAYVLLFILIVASVFKLISPLIPFLATIVTLFILDRKTLLTTDYSLVLTFVFFFIFSGNMARIPALAATLSPLMENGTLFVSAGLSQIISNVPAAVFLSHFTDSYQALLVGVNVGGAGTLIASLASLITFDYFLTLRKNHPENAALSRYTPKRFILVFSLYNGAFLAILLGVSAFYL